jgi:hypothetical protein
MLFRQRPSAPANKVANRRTKLPDLQVLSDDLGGTAETVSHSLAVMDLRKKNRASCPVLLVRVEGLDFDDHRQEDRVAATVLYNYAMTFVVQTSRIPEPGRATSLARGARVLDAAMGLVASSALAPELQSDPERWWLLRYLVESSALRVGAHLLRLRSHRGHRQLTTTTGAAAMVPDHGDDDATRIHHRLLLSVRRTARQLSAYRDVLSEIAIERQVAAAA